MQPREKLHSKGPAALTNNELLKALIGSGNAEADVGKIAASTLAVLKQKGADITYADLRPVKGLGAAKTTQILAAIELSRRFLTQTPQPIIDSPGKAFDLLRHLGDKRQEHFVMLTLDGANRLIQIHTISIGTLTTSLVHPREVFAAAIADHAASIIVAHNHPSGSLKASAADIETTRRLDQAGQLIGISLLDHFVITSTAYAPIFMKEKTQ
jgi:DNA repair protein RadC